MIIGEVYGFHCMKFAYLGRELPRKLVIIKDQFVDAPSAVGVHAVPLV